MQVRDSHVAMLQNVQDSLWEDFAWPHLRVRRDVALATNQRYYALPRDLTIERLEKAEVAYAGGFIPLKPQITAYDRSVYNSDLLQTSWPSTAYELAEDGTLEVWPVPSVSLDPTTQDGTLRLTGIRNLKPLVDDDDRCDLDGRMLVLFVAAMLMASSGDKGAGMKQAAAVTRLNQMKANLSPVRRFQMFGVGMPTSNRRDAIAQYRPPK